MESNSSIFSDQELIEKIKTNTDYLGVVYNKCKKNCISFMRKSTGGKINDYELEDIFQDSSIILYEKIVKGDFQLTSTFQTYLNSVCKFQLLNKVGKNNLITDFQENRNNEGDDENEDSMEFSPFINDSFEIEEDIKETKLTAIEKALEKLEQGGGHCYELLTLFWYHKKSMADLTELFGYTNSDNTKSQKAKCQKRLEKLAFNELNN
jgi:RNA polymerase sigma factor (sigma-70 family)